MAFLNVNTPLKNLKTGDYFYPLTNLDQIITGNNRLSAFMSEDNNLLNLSNIGNLSVNGNITGNNGIFSNHLTIGSSTLNTDYTFYVNGTSYFNNNVFINREIHPKTESTQVGITPLIVFAMKNGKTIYDDSNFYFGTNGVNIYNNNGNGTVIHTRDIYSNFGLAHPGNGSGYIIRIQNIGSASPGIGGFYQNIWSGSNKIFVQIFRALIPIGRNVITASNSMGDYYQDTWITSQAGTGKWEWYARIVHCGNSGSFSGGGHVFLDGAAGSSSAPVTWYLASCNVYELTDEQYDAIKAKYIEGTNEAHYPGGALLRSGRGRVDDSNTGDTWIYWDTLGGTTTPWGIRHSQGPNRIDFLGGGNLGTYITLNSGYLYSNTLTGASVASSWLDGQRYEDRGGFNLTNATDTGSYWPWMRQTNTGSKKYFSFGILNTGFYWIGSATSRTANGYDYGMTFNVANGYLQGCSRVYAAVWNDYAEFRKGQLDNNLRPGQIVAEIGDGSMKLANKKLQKGCKIISDTYGFAIGETEDCKLPIAVSGRVLIYCDTPKEELEPGDCLCSNYTGNAIKMTQEEIIQYPDRIVATVSEIPSYKYWKGGSGQNLTPQEEIEVNGRIWVYVK